MNQKVIEAIKNKEIDLNGIKSWEIILETNERELAETKLPRWPPNDLYILEREDFDGFKEVWSSVPTEMKVKGRKLLQYLQEEEQKKLEQRRDQEQQRRDQEQQGRDQERQKRIAQFEKELNLKRALEAEKQNQGVEKLSVEGVEKTQPPETISGYFSTLKELIISQSNDENISEIGDLFEFMNRDELLMEIFLWFKHSYEQDYELTRPQNKPNFKFGSCYSSTGMGKTTLLKSGMKKMIRNIEDIYAKMLQNPREDHEYNSELQNAFENVKFSEVLQKVR